MVAYGGDITNHAGMRTILLRVVEHPTVFLGCGHKSVVTVEREALCVVPHVGKHEPAQQNEGKCEIEGDECEV